MLDLNEITLCRTVDSKLERRSCLGVNSGLQTLTESRSHNEEIVIPSRSDYKEAGRLRDHRPGPPAAAGGGSSAGRRGVIFRPAGPLRPPIRMMQADAGDIDGPCRRGSVKFKLAERSLSRPPGRHY